MAIIASTDLPTADGSVKTLRNAGVPSNGTSEVDTLTFGGTPTGGTFTLTYDGQTTAAITWSSTNVTLVAAIQAALDALSNIGASNTVVAVGTMTAGIGTITVTFAADLAALDVAVMTRTSSLTGTSPTLAVATTTPGITATARGAVKGALLIDTLNAKLYINTGTTTSPTWTVVGSQT